MSDTPLEATLVVKLHEQMAKEFETLDTITTSGKREKQVGFDTTVSVAKPIYLQYKRPYLLDDGSIIEFGIKENQRETLVEFANSLSNPSVFYAFPLITAYKWLPETLSRTLFVDARAVTENSTHVYVPNGYANHGRIPRRFRGEKLDVCINGQRVPESIPHDQMWAWEEFKSLLERCKFGIRIETEPPETELDIRSNRRHGTVSRLPNTETSVTVIGGKNFETTIDPNP